MGGKVFSYYGFLGGEIFSEFSLSLIRGGGYPWGEDRGIFSPIGNPRGRDYSWGEKKARETA